MTLHDHRAPTTRALHCGRHTTTTAHRKCPIRARNSTTRHAVPDVGASAAGTPKFRSDATLMGPEAATSSPPTTFAHFIARTHTTHGLPARWCVRGHCPLAFAIRISPMLPIRGASSIRWSMTTYRRRAGPGPSAGSNDLVGSIVLGQLAAAPRRYHCTMVKYTEGEKGPYISLHSVLTFHRIGVLTGRGPRLMHVPEVLSAWPNT